MPKKILIISQYFLPDINAASYRIDDLYSALRKLNFDVTVVTTYPQKFAVEEVKEDSAIHRLVLSKVEKKSFINYIKNYFGFMFKSMFYSLFRLRKKKFDYIFVTSPPLFVALGGVLIAFLKRTKLILDIRDIWPDSAVAARSEEHTSELQSRFDLVCRLLLEKKKTRTVDCDKTKPAALNKVQYLAEVKVTNKSFLTKKLSIVVEVTAAEVATSAEASTIDEIE